MVPLTDLLQQGSARALLFIPGAIPLVSLHRLEPSRPKTMMVAFIIAVRGTSTLAVILSLPATLSRSAVVRLNAPSRAANVAGQKVSVCRPYLSWCDENMTALDPLLIALRHLCVNNDDGEA